MRVIYCFRCGQRNENLCEMVCHTCLVRVLYCYDTFIPVKVVLKIRNKGEVKDMDKQMFNLHANDQCDTMSICLTLDTYLCLILSLKVVDTVFKTLRIYFHKQNVANFIISKECISFIKVLFLTLCVYI